MADPDITRQHDAEADTPNAVLVGGPLAGIAVLVPDVDQPVRLQDDHGVWQEYRPTPDATQSADGQPAPQAVFHHYMAAKHAEKQDEA